MRSNRRPKKNINEFFSWKKRTHLEKTNLILACASIASLFLIFLMTMESNKISRNALEIADTSNVLTRESLDFAKKSAQVSSKNTEEALKRSDSSLSISEKSLFITYENLKTIRDNARNELRAYVQADSVYMDKFLIGIEIGVNLKLTNSGKTPAYNIRGLNKVKLGGTGIYETDFATLKDTMTSLFIGGNDGYIIFYNLTKHILTMDDSINICNGSLFFGYYATFSYEDIFGNIDSLRVCRYYDPQINKFVLCQNYLEHKHPF